MRTQLSFAVLFATVFACSTHATPAQAQSRASRVFVSGTGSDGNPCTFASPCRTFQHAQDVASSNSEINVLDPAGYGAVIISKAISIQGHGFGGISVGSGGTGITINAAASDKVALGGLLINGGGVGANGIVLNTGGSLTITNCDVRNFMTDGILIQPSPGTTQFLIADVVVANNANSGIDIYPPGPTTGMATGTVDHALLHANGTGLKTDRNTNSTIADVTIRNTVATNNGTGYMAASVGDFTLYQSTATENGTGIFVNTDAQSAGNNLFFDNTTDVAGFFSTIGTQ